MVRTRTDHIILWPTYFDSRKSRSEGRRVPRSVSIDGPTAEEVHRAVKGLGLSATMDASKSHPNSWWEKEGMVRVENSLGKEELIRLVAARLKETEGDRSRK
jgi:signal recognition particle subunit SRP19